MTVFRITRGKIQPGTWDEFEATLREAMDDVGQVPGLISRSLLRNLDDPNEGYTISTWESEAAVKNYEQSELAKSINPVLEKYFTGDYDCSHCEAQYWERRD